MADHVAGGGEMADPYPNRLAQALGTELDRRGWSNRRAGTEIGLNHVTVGAIVLGTVPNPSWETLHKIAVFLGIDDHTARDWLKDVTEAGALEASPDARSGKVGVPVQGWLTVDRMRLFFYDVASTLTPDEQESLLPAFEHQYRRKLAERDLGERDGRRGAEGPAPAE